MAFDFPNPSRSYGGERHGVRFWGHDSVRNVQEDALARINQNDTAN